MPDTLPSLNDLLARFSSATITRSRSYLSKVYPDSLDIWQEEETVHIEAVVAGSHNYRCTVQYYAPTARITHTYCDCPVTHYCKHAAALIGVFYQRLLQHQQLSQYSAPDDTARQQQKARAWLTELEQVLQQTEPSVMPEVRQQPFVYLLDRRHGALYLGINKVRRIKSGEIRDSKPYSAFYSLPDNTNLPEPTRRALSQIYRFSTLSSGFYQPQLTITHLPLPPLRHLIDSRTVYWQESSGEPLAWHNVPLSLHAQWQENQTSARLQLTLSDSLLPPVPLHGQDRLLLLPTEPLICLDRQHNHVRPIETELDTALLASIADMPDIPLDLLPQLDDKLSAYAQTRNLPKPEAVRNIPSVYGRPQALIRFSDTNPPRHGQTAADISFVYESATLPARSPGNSVFATVQGKRVRQWRDAGAEQQALAQLHQLFPSLSWLSDGTCHAQIATEEIIRALLPDNRLAAGGWQVEHQAGSATHLETAPPPDWHIADHGDEGGWFEIGATIRDSSGHTYDLLDILAHALHNRRELLNPDFWLSDHRQEYITLPTEAGRPALAVPLTEVQPILQHMQHLLEQDGRQADHYDADYLAELSHRLGMAWQIPGRLKNFTDKLAQGYQSSLPTPQGFNGSLRPYQQQGLAWLQFLRDTGHGGILADDMGLGKTAQTLAHILLEKQAGRLNGKPVLIVAPTSLMHNWQKEAAKFTPELSVLLLHGSQRHTLFDSIPRHDIVLTTYPLLPRDEERLAAHTFHQLILDEAQNIKNPQSKAAQVLRHIPADHRLCLTGTPMENHLGELWSLFYFLMPGFLGSQDVFNKKYRHPIEKRHDGEQRDRLVKRIHPFVLRRLKTEVAQELPAKTTIEVHIDMNDAQSKLYEAVRATMQQNIRKIIAEQGFKRSQIQILDALLKLRQVCCHPALLKLDGLTLPGKTAAKTTAKPAGSAKLDHLADMVSSLVDEGRKILIFSQFTTMLSLIEARLAEQNIAMTKLTGQTKKRAEAIEAFQSGDASVFLISLKAGGTGLNLTAADTVIHYDPWWNPAAESQASDRAWRIGQDKPVFVYKLITNQSIEEKIAELQNRKAALADSVLGADHEGEDKLGEADLLGLLESF